MQLSPVAARYDHLLVDLDGSLWVGDEPLPGAVGALDALRATGRRVAFLAGDGHAGAEDVVRKLWRLGFRASTAEVVTLAGAVQFRLAGRAGGTAFVIGPDPLIEHVGAAGLRIVNRTDLASRADVVVAAAHSGFDFDELRTAVQAVLRGATLVATTRAATTPMPDGPWPAAGAVLAAIEAAGGRRADCVLGAPEPGLVEAALDRLGAGRALLVSDSIDADVESGRRAGIDTALVLTGATTRAQAAAADPAPTFVAESLAALLLEDA